jgi:aldehyde:ferredoxin oxidoreductase
MVLKRKIAYINLTSKEIKTTDISENLTRDYIGGRGIGALLLNNTVKKGIEPLSPDNVIVVSAGLLAGTLASSSARTCIAYLSPLDGYLGGANIGGFFAPELHWAGFDHLVITGKAPKPSYVLVQDGKVRINDASSIWGESVPDTQEILRKELEDDDVQTLCIGPAGENQVRYAGVGTRYEAVSGRGGCGAVFGSKNLKAIVAGGGKGIQIVQPEQALEYDTKVVNELASTDFGKKLRRGVSYIDGYDDVEMTDYTVGPEGCFGCQFYCERRYAIKVGRYAGTYGQGLGYRVQRAWSEITDSRIGSILATNNLTNSYGLDNLETANIIAWAMKLYDEGILTDTDTGGLDLRPGNDEAVHAIIKLIARREGPGAILAEGGTRAAGILGKGSEKYLRLIKGIADLFGDNPPTPWQALGTATANRGVDHIRFLPPNDPCNLLGLVLRGMVNNPVAYNGPLSSGCEDYTGRPWLVLWHHYCGMAADMLGICQFHTQLFNPDGLGFDEFSRLLLLNNGIELSSQSIWDAACRAFNLERMLNLRAGYSGINDYPDARYFMPAAGRDGEKVLDRAQFTSMLREYYFIQGWDGQGLPTKETLKKLSL